MTDNEARRPVLGEEEEIAASGAPLLKPWRTVVLDPEYGGCWSVAGDLDADGQVEIVSAQNYNADDVHYTSAVVAQRLDGTVMWRWGDPKVGRKRLHHDVACQIHDWNGDGVPEVILLTDGYLVHLEGPTGREIRRIAIPPQSSDCVAFVDLDGVGRPTDVLVKTRYTDIWALAYDGTERWHVNMPGGHRTAHQARPIDIDGDGRDEIMAGYALLNPDGSVRWVFRSNAVDVDRGHLDCMRVLSWGASPAECRLALSCCGAKNLAVVDGEGRTVWEVSGYHYESLDIGRFCPDVPGPQIAVDIDHVPWAESPVWIYNEHGERISQMTTVYSRSHRRIAWGDLGDVLSIARPRGLFSCSGNRLATFDLRLPDGTDQVEAVQSAVGDMTGDGVPDILLNTEAAVYIFRNPASGPGDAPLGSGLNFTFY